MIRKFLLGIIKCPRYYSMIKSEFKILTLAIFEQRRIHLQHLQYQVAFNFPIVIAPLCVNRCELLIYFLHLWLDLYFEVSVKFFDNGEYLSFSVVGKKFICLSSITQVIASRKEFVDIHTRKSASYILDILIFNSYHRGFLQVQPSLLPRYYLENG